MLPKNEPHPLLGPALYKMAAEINVSNLAQGSMLAEQKPPEMDLIEDAIDRMIISGKVDYKAFGTLMNRWKFLAMEWAAKPQGYTEAEL